VIDGAPQRAGRKYADFLASRPAPPRNRAIEGLIALAGRLGGRVHVLHLSSSGALPLLAAARRDGVRITVETCPHLPHPDRRGSAGRRHRVQVLPADPRGAANQDALWQALADGLIDCVVLGPLALHCGPQAPGHRRFRRGLGRHLLAATGAARGVDRGPPPRPHPRRRRPLDVRRPGPPSPDWRPPRAPSPRASTPTSRCSPPTRPSPSTRPGCGNRNPITAYAGRTLSGVVRSTWLRGQVVARDGSVTGEPAGRLIERPARRELSGTREGLRPRGAPCGGAPR